MERIFINTMDAAAVGPGFPFNLPFGAGTGGGTVTINLAGGGPRRLQFKHTLDFLTGEFTVVVDVDADTSGSACWVEVADDASGTCTGGLASGSNVISCSGIAQNSTIQKLDVVCPAGAGALTLDWLTAQNGPYVFAPLTDQDIEVTGTRAPSGGAMVVTRTDEYRDLMFVGSNVGGFAWSDDGENWTTANGRAQDLDSHDTLGIFEILAWDDDADIYTDQPLFVQTGFQYTSGSATFVSEDMGQSWEPADEDQSLGIYKLVDDCTNNGGVEEGQAEHEAKNAGSGKTLLLEPAVEDSNPWDVMYIAAGEDQTVGSTTIPGKRGIWIKQLDSGGQVCQPYNPATLATAANTSVGIDAIPSAMLLGNVSYSDPEVAGSTHLLVGYRVLARGSGGADRTALYLCPSVQFEGWACGDTQLSCQPVVDDGGDELLSAELDVRDMVTVPLDPFNWTVAIADGGRRAKDADPNECWNADEVDDDSVVRESTVVILQLDSPVNAPTMNLWNSDGDWAEPLWAVDTLDLPAEYYGTNKYGCSRAASDHFGDLVAPSSGAAASVTSLVSDPDGEYLFATYPAGPGLLEYGCVRVFRTEVADLAEGWTPWIPLQEWVAGEMGGETIENETDTAGYDDGPHAEQRRSVVLLQDSWFSETGRSDVNAPGWAVDEEFIDLGGEQPEYVMLVGSMQLWLVPPQWGAATPGWDTVPGGALDLDGVPWILAFGGEGSTAFQDVGVNDVGVCHECDGGRDLVYAANQDVKYYRAPGPSSDVVADEPASTPCPFEKTGDGGTAIDAGTFYDEDTEGDVNVVWFAGNPQTNTTDEGAIRTLYVSTDAGDTYCWDRAEGTNIGSFFSARSGDAWQLDCSDRDWAGDEEFKACDETHTTDMEVITHMDDEADVGIGMVRSIKVIDAHRALLLATTACVDYDTSGNSCTTYGGGGLFVATYDPVAGIVYEHVPTNSAAWSSSSWGTCAGEDDRFSWSGGPKMWMHPDTDWEIGSGNTARVFISFHRDTAHCDGGLAEVTFDVDDPTGGTTWWRFDTLTENNSTPAMEGLGAWAATNNMWAMAGSPDGTRVLLGGAAVQTLSTTPVQEVRDYGWITSIEVDDPAGPGPATGNGAVSWIHKIVIPAAQPSGAPTFPFLIGEIIPHPHINGQWYFGGHPSSACPTCQAAGVYGLQRWWSAGAGAWSWGWRRASNDHFENGRLQDLNWGNDATNPHSCGSLSPRNNFGRSKPDNRLTST